MSSIGSRYRLNATEAASRSRASMSYIAYDHALQSVLDGLYALITAASGTGEFAITVSAEQLLDLFVRAGLDISATTKDDPGIGDVGPSTTLSRRSRRMGTTPCGVLARFWLGGAGDCLAVCLTPPKSVSNTPATTKDSPCMTDMTPAIMKHEAETLATELATTWKTLVNDDSHEPVLACAIAPGVLAIPWKGELFDIVLRRLGNTLNASKLKSDVYPLVLRYLRANASLPLDSVRPFLFASDVTGWGWDRLPFDPNEYAESPPTFTEILSRTTPDEARSLTLFIGSLLDYDTPRTQYLHLSGPGKGGKSTITKLLWEAFGRRLVRELRADEFARDNHATTQLEGCRLVVFNDENNSGFMSSGKFKALTGDDYLSINPKGMPRRTIRLACKVVICSNQTPEILGNSADMRRIIPVTLGAYEGVDDATFVPRLLADKHRVLQFCYAQYCKWKSETGLVYLPTAEDRMADVVADSTIAAAEDLMHALFEPSMYGDLPPHAVKERINKACSGNRPLASATYEAVKRTYGSPKRVNSDPRSIRGIRYLGIGGDALEAPGSNVSRSTK